MVVIYRLETLSQQDASRSLASLLDVCWVGDGDE